MTTLPRSRARRRLLALPLVVGLALSWAVEVGASLCTSATAMADDADMRMPMHTAAADVMEGGLEHQGEHGNPACPPVDDADTPLCPFAVGGTGPCGTTVPAPGVATLIPQIALERSFRVDERVSAAADRSPSIPLPPPRLTA